MCLYPDSLSFRFDADYARSILHGGQKTYDTYQKVKRSVGTLD